MTINNLAPLNIIVKDSNGEEISLKDTLGQYVVLYFYPKDNTPGCTTEACSFRDANEEIENLGAKIIGISKDSPESHQKFSKKYNLNFELWSDQSGELMTAFGAFGEKKMFGKTFLGIKRSTFILDPKGKVIKIYKTVKPKEHTQQVLKFLKKYLSNE
ncbi:MAG: thioredoxin-dependent thiol peroxidase [Candidatus Pacebacteria bacterium]|nr:thioredoxin-dependent thiol peroxidase [Candidatus Paceibacterota bacterium]